MALKKRQRTLHQGRALSRLFWKSSNTLSTLHDAIASEFRVPKTILSSSQAQMAWLELHFKYQRNPKREKQRSIFSSLLSRTIHKASQGTFPPLVCGVASPRSRGVATNGARCNGVLLYYCRTPLLILPAKRFRTH